MNIIGYLVSIIFSNIVPTFFILKKIHVNEYISFGQLNRIKLKGMLSYSIPLIPNYVAWWLNSSSDRVFILVLCGSAYNGLYAMANKIPTIVNTITNIFFQSWQMSVVEEFKKKDSKAFISNTFGFFLSFMFFMSIFLLGITKPVLSVFVDKSFFESWKLVPLLLLSVLYSSISSFLGTVYTASKKTVSILITTIYGAIVNIISTYVFIKMIGLNGAALANTVSFLLVSILRFKDIYKLNKISLNLNKLILLHLLFSLEVVIILFVKNYFTMMFFTLFIMTLQISMDKDTKKLIYSIFSFLKSKIGLKTK